MKSIETDGNLKIIVHQIR